MEKLLMILRTTVEGLHNRFHDEGARNAVKDVLTKISAHVAEYQGALGAIDVEGHLTQKGRQAATAKLNRELLSKVNAYSEQVAALESNAASRAVKLAPVSPFAKYDAAVQFLAEQEIRQHLRQTCTVTTERGTMLDTVKIESMLGDPAVYFSVLHSPLPLVSTGALHQAEVQLASNLDPVAAQYVSELRGAAQTIQSTIADVTREVGEAPGIKVLD